MTSLSTRLKLQNDPTTTETPLFEAVILVAGMALAALLVIGFAAI